MADELFRSAWRAIAVRGPVVWIPLSSEQRHVGPVLRPVRPNDDLIENQPMKLRPRRPMSFYELICWHRANGTLLQFLAGCGL